MKDINLIRKIAWSFHKSTNADWDDLFQEAAEGYYKGLKTYNPKQGALSTHVWHCMCNQLKNYLHKEERYKYASIDEIDPISTKDISFWENLSIDAWEIANAILIRPSVFLNASKESVMQRIYNIMRNKGWSKNRIKHGVHELILYCNMY